MKKQLGRKSKALLILLTFLIPIGIGFVITSIVASRLPVSHGAYEAIYPVSKLKEYSSYGRGQYYTSSNGYNVYVFYKLATLFMDPGIYRIAFDIKAENFTDSTPYVLLTTAFDSMSADIGTTLDSASGQERRVTYTYDNFEVEPPSAPERTVPATIIVLMMFPPQEQGGIVTIYFNAEMYQTQFAQFATGLVFMIVGVSSTIALAVFRRSKETPAAMSQNNGAVE